MFMSAMVKLLFQLKFVMNVDCTVGDRLYNATDFHSLYY
jgi:hypothetical protein